ncbi:MAG: permease [Candidatus Izemoplasmataceae bacterium]
MRAFVKKHKFLLFTLLVLVVITIIDIRLTYTALDNTWSYVLDMLIIVPPIFILIGLFDVWIERETVIRHMGEESGARGMALAFFLGAFSAGPTVAAFPLAMVMLKKGARYSNVLFFLMVWSSLKIPVVFYQFTQLGFTFAMIINVTMFIVFVLGAIVSSSLFEDEEVEAFREKAENYIV